MITENKMTAPPPDLKAVESNADTALETDLLTENKELRAMLAKALETSDQLLYIISVLKREIRCKEEENAELSRLLRYLSAGRGNYIEYANTIPS